jgi:AraC-like DNA-binding protein
MDTWFNMLEPPVMLVYGALHVRLSARCGPRDLGKIAVRTTESVPVRAYEPTRSPSSMRRIDLAKGEDWTVCDCICTAGPGDRRFEERHDDVSLALVTAGTFEYRTSTGDAVLYPGAYLLGNDGECYECGHTHSAGDRCLAIHVSRKLFEEVAASAAGSSRFRFRHPFLPARPELTHLAASLQSLATSKTGLAVDESVYTLIETVVSALQAHAASTRQVAAKDVRRLSAALHYIDMHASGCIQLEQLAAIASMSKFHFLRTFRRVTGTTPYRFVLATRLRRAAASLASTRLPIGTIALNEGFNDLSSFNRYFRRMLKLTPKGYRSSFRLPRPS